MWENQKAMERKKENKKLNDPTCSFNNGYE